MRSALVASVTIAKADDSGAFTINGHDLGAETNAEPADQSVETVRGDNRRSGFGYNVNIHSLKVANFDTLDGWQRAGELLNVTFTYDDASSVKVRRVGFTVTDEIPGQVGAADGWRLAGSGYSATQAGVLTISPALPAAD